MVSLGSNMEKLQVMSRLRNLKDAEPCFNRIRVACDFSQEDREQIRKLVLETKKILQRIWSFAILFLHQLLQTNKGTFLLLIKIIA